VNAIDFDRVDTLKNALLSVPLPQEIADNKRPGEPHEVTWADLRKVGFKRVG
jgi:hypothetical protein